MNLINSMKQGHLLTLMENKVLSPPELILRMQISVITYNK